MQFAEHLRFQVELVTTILYTISGCDVKESTPKNTVQSPLQNKRFIQTKFRVTQQ